MQVANLGKVIVSSKNYNNACVFSHLSIVILHLVKLNSHWLKTIHVDYFINCINFPIHYPLSMLWRSCPLPIVHLVKISSITPCPCYEEAQYAFGYIKFTLTKNCPFWLLCKLSFSNSLPIVHVVKKKSLIHYPSYENFVHYPLSTLWKNYPLPIIHLVKIPSITHLPWC